MIFGVGCATQFGGLVFPFHMVPLVVLGVASGVTGQEINFLQYMIFAWPTAIAAMLLYIAMGKYVFRFDVSQLEGMNFDVADKSKLTLNKRQKIGAIYLLLFLVLLLVPNMLPEGNVIRALLKQQGNVGLTFILLASMCWVKVDGQPFVNIQKCAAGGIQWDIVMIFAFVLPFATLFTHEATGVSPAVISTLGPLLAGKGQFMFIILILIFAGVLTNFANNMVVGSITVTLMNMVAGGLNLDIMAVSCAIILIISFAFATPSASTASAMCFANEWCDRKTAFKVGILYSVIGIILFVPIAYVLIGLIF
jgi:sodium-dependent dicarboxylate transporter 2/3/5